MRSPGHLVSKQHLASLESLQKLTVLRPGDLTRPARRYNLSERNAARAEDIGTGTALSNADGGSAAPAIAGDRHCGGRVVRDETRGSRKGGGGIGGFHGFTTVVGIRQEDLTGRTERCPSAVSMLSSN